MKKIILSILAILLIGCSQQGENTQAPVAGNPAQKAGNIVEMTSSGFVPQTLTIKVGDAVTWINKDTTEHWPASAMHPTHTAYPGSGIEKCGTGNEIFDACEGIAKEASFSFKFINNGSWAYHDHMNPRMFGKIIVE